MDRRLFKPLSEWTLDDVCALVDERIPEGQRLDYKQDLLLKKETERAEVAKDVSGLANAQGGLLIYGVSEDKSDEPRPLAITPMPSEGQQTKVEDILDSTVQPRLDYACRTLDVEDGSLLIVRVAPRAGGPHMVQGYKQHRYFIRRGTRTVPMSEDEVRTAYEAARIRADRMRELLAGLPLAPRIGRPRSFDDFQAVAHGLPVPTKVTPFVSVVTAPFDGAPELISMGHVRPDAFPEPQERYVAPNRKVRTEGYFTIDAFGLSDELLLKESDDAAPYILNRVRLYREGVCEWAHRYANLPDEYVIPSTAFAQDVYNTLAYFASVYDMVGYAGRLAVYVRIDNAEKAWLGLSQQLAQLRIMQPTGMEAIGDYRETTVDALLADPLPLVRDTMQLTWQSFGYRECRLFDAAGNWVPLD